MCRFSTVEAARRSDAVIPAMGRVRAQADRLERFVAGDFWPLPSYAEMLFIR